MESIIFDKEFKHHRLSLILEEKTKQIQVVVICCCFFYFIITDKFVKTQTELYEPLSEYFSQFNMQYKRQNSGRIKNNRENTAAMENKRMPRNSVI